MMLFGVLLLVALFTSDVAAQPPPETELEKQAKMEQDLGKRGLSGKGLCGDDVYYFGHCYKFVSDEKTWADAELYCQTLHPGSHLASVHFENQNAFIGKLISSEKGKRLRAWIGLHDLFKEDTFLWTDGSSTDFTGWSQNEPNNDLHIEDCVNTERKNQVLWNDLPCSETLPFICSYKLPCC
ncbi:lectin-like [Scyliorhinus canicula]|uniref:lectin-like n=1 Tax=Scyliorhinus canicula TaxID=7830 RepID=UPI0018F7400F|nr:lectin-like [Scyliorhinus canicula]